MQYRKKKIGALVLWGIAILCLLFTFWHFQNETVSGAGTELRFIDVGNADCCLLTSENGGNILIDAGNKGDGNLIKSHMQLRQAEQLDAVFISHFHADHMGGLLDLLKDETVSIKTIYYPDYSESNENKEAVMALAGKRGTETVPLTAGDELSVGAFHFSVLLPKNIISSDEAFTGENDENNRSLVLKLSVGATTALFVGDLEKDGESFLKFEDHMKSDILKVGHHGLATSSSADFLAKIQPGYAVVPTGHNSYGHPSRKVLDRLSGIGAVVLRSDQCGTLRFILNENGIEDVIAEKKIK